MESLKAEFSIDQSTIWRNTKEKGLAAGEGCNEKQLLSLLRLWQEDVAGSDLGDLNDQEALLMIVSMVNAQALRRKPAPPPSAFDLPVGGVLPGSSRLPGDA